MAGFDTWLGLLSPTLLLAPTPFGGRQAKALVEGLPLRHFLAAQVPAGLLGRLEAGVDGTLATGLIEAPLTLVELAQALAGKTLFQAALGLEKPLALGRAHRCEGLQPLALEFLDLVAALARPGGHGRFGQGCCSSQHGAGKRGAGEQQGGAERRKGFGVS